MCHYLVIILINVKFTSLIFISKIMISNVLFCFYQVIIYNIDNI